MLLLEGGLPYGNSETQAPSNLWLSHPLGLYHSHLATGRMGNCRNGHTLFLRDPEMSHITSTIFTFHWLELRHIVTH